MLKKLIKFGMLAGVMLFACNAYAQEKSNLEYPRYGFKSNWSLGGELIYSWDMNQGGPFQWCIGSNAGFGIVLEKELNHIFAVRGHLAIPGLFATDSSKLAAQNGEPHYDRYGIAAIDFKFSLTGLKYGYDPTLRHSWYLIAGAGINSQVNVDRSFGWMGDELEAGIGYSLKCGQNGTFFAEYIFDAIGDVPMPLKFWLKEKWHDMDSRIAIGWMYNWGPTAEDMDMIAQISELNQEKFDAKNDEIESLQKDLKDAKKREAQLINRINELEANQGIGPNGTTIIKKQDDAVADSLRKVIAGYEANKLNFYALPFSILYGVDEYTVSDDQMNKVKAIAQIMKDTDCDFEIIGYCDYSGSDAYNQKLSEKRAENVKKLLVNKYGVDENRLTTSGKGKSMSFGDIKNAVNRRVSFYRVNK